MKKCHRKSFTVKISFTLGITRKWLSVLENKVFLCIRQKMSSALDKIYVALLWKFAIAFHSLMARKPKGREKSCVAAPLGVRNNILLLRKLVVVKIKFRQNLMQKWILYRHFHPHIFIPIRAV